MAQPEPKPINAWPLIVMAVAVLFLVGKLNGWF